jgi:5-hydroxyisourate hydrolase
MKSPITTHVLDTSAGRPAAGVSVRLEKWQGADFREVGRGVTNDDGRVADLLAGPSEAGKYLITFDTASYFASRGLTTFFPEVSIVFEITNPQQHHHVPLLLSPFGYSTYRGS